MTNELGIRKKEDDEHRNNNNDGSLTIVQSREEGIEDGWIERCGS